MKSELNRFIEKIGFGSRTGRHLLVRSGDELPPAAQGCAWLGDPLFDADDEQSCSTGFGQVITTVRRDGFAIVTGAVQ